MDDAGYEFTDIGIGVARDGDRFYISITLVAGDNRMFEMRLEHDLGAELRDALDDAVSACRAAIAMMN